MHASAPCTCATPVQVCVTTLSPSLCPPHATTFTRACGLFMHTPCACGLDALLPKYIVSPSSFAVCYAKAYLLHCLLRPHPCPVLMYLMYHCYCCLNSFHLWGIWFETSEQALKGWPCKHELLGFCSIRTPAFSFPPMRSFHAGLKSPPPAGAFSALSEWRIPSSGTFSAPPASRAPCTVGDLASQLPAYAARTKEGAHACVGCLIGL